MTAAAAVLLVAVTFYQPTGSPTASGEWPHPGTAGCSADIPLGTILALPDGLVVTCDDRGLDGWMAPHVDVFCPDDYEACEAEIPEAADWTARQPAAVVRWGPGP